MQLHAFLSRMSFTERGVPRAENQNDLKKVSCATIFILAAFFQQYYGKPFAKAPPSIKDTFDTKTEANDLSSLFACQGWLDFTS